ncbi:sensor histidine kinase [Parapedobacter deserti]|uniref:histidine kinase n=1 Tax=Parapedobacter deserti TaxID=1912957 RepID=A0ABV7JJS3_9SPHI
MDIYLFVQVPKPYVAAAVIVGTIVILAIWTIILLFFRLYNDKLRLAEEAARRREAEVQNQLNSNRIKVAERTMQEISAAIHDHLGHRMAFLCTLLADELSEYHRKHPFTPETIGKCHALAADVLQKLRQLNSIMQAEQLLKQGLSHAIGELVALLKSRPRPLIATDVSLYLDDAVAADTALHIFRILQEATANATKYADADFLQISLTMKNDHQAELIVVDNGKGFDPSPRNYGIGLTNLHGYAKAIGGTVHINSTPGKGTEVRVDIPIGHLSTKLTNT